MKSNNVIEINGRLYDAKSGKPIQSTTKATNNQPKPAQTHKTVDGFSRPKHAKAANNHRVATLKSTVAPKRHNVERSSVQSAKRSVSRSLTLNRNAVKAPVHAASVAIAEPKKPAVSTTAMKHADSQRLERAKLVTRSSSVAKFNHSNVSTSSETASVPLQASSLTQHLEKTHLKVPEAQLEQKTVSTKDRLIDHAVTNAPVHHTKKQKRYHKKTSVLGKYATSGLVALVLGAYVAYLNIPSISMKVAAHRAGFAATMPGYKPAGYSLKGPIAYSPGQVTVNFQSNTDERQFSLKQQPTTWDSTALLENFVVKETPNYLTYQDRGLTIYIYDGSNAAWVNGGKLYNLEGDNAQLDTDQLLKLATSV